MREEDILEGNKMIAEFISTDQKKDQRSFWINVPGKELRHWVCDRDLKYHSDWTWLMPVVEKIESLDNKRFGFNIDPHDIQIVDYKTGNENGIVYSTRQEYSLMEALYEAVSLFIQWYNKEQGVQERDASKADSNSEAGTKRI